MHGIVIDINPVALQIGGLEIRWYSLAIVLGIIVAILLAAREAKRKGLSSSDIYGLAPWVIVAGMVGARLFHVVDRWDLYSGNPALIFQIQQGGLAVWGALVGGGLATVIYARIKHIRLGRLLDVLVPALLAAQIIGRFGCIVNGDAYGGVTTLPWGFIYTHPDAEIPASLLGVPTHPYPVYEMLWNSVALVLVYRFRKFFRHDGLLFLGYLAHYSLVRFSLSFFRQEKAVLGGLQQAQVLAIVGLAVAAALFIFLVVRARHQGAAKSA